MTRPKRITAINLIKAFYLPIFKIRNKKKRHKFVHPEVIRWMKDKEEERQEFKGTKYYNL